MDEELKRKILEKLSEYGEHMGRPGASMRQGIEAMQDGRLPSRDELIKAFQEPETAPTGADIAENVGLDDDQVLAKTALATAVDFLDPMDVVPLGMVSKGAKALGKAARSKKLLGQLDEVKRAHLQALKNDPERILRSQPVYSQNYMEAVYDSPALDEKRLKDLGYSSQEEALEAVMPKPRYAKSLKEEIEEGRKKSLDSDLYSSDITPTEDTPVMDILKKKKKK